MENALNVLIENECKLALEEMGYVFSNDKDVVSIPIGFPILYSSATVEPYYTASGGYSMQMRILPLEYKRLYDIVDKANKELMSDYKELIHDFLPKAITPESLAEIRVRFQMLFDKHFIGFTADFEVEVEGNGVVLNPNNETTRNLWVKRIK